MSNTLEIIITALGLIQGIGILLRRKDSWLAYNAMILLTLIFSFSVKLWGDVLENSIYIIMGVYALINQYNKKSEKIVISISKPKIIGFEICISFIIFIVLYIRLIQTNDPLPVLDAMTTATGLIATFTMAKSRLETWVWWFANDILRVICYYNLPDQALYLMVLNIIWTGMAVGSFISWRKSMKNEVIYNEQKSV